VISVPVAHALNPALNGADERINFDFGYTALAPTRSGEKGLGSVVNAAATIPSRIGVWGFSAHYFGSELPGLQIGPLGALHASFAKELYPQIFLGAGLGLQVGEDPLAPEGEQEWAWGGGLDVGFLHRPGRVGPIKDLAWGLAMRGIGKGISAPLEGYRVYAPAFTPAIGVSLTPLHTKDIAFSTGVDLWAPTFQSLRGEVGAALSVSDFLRISAYYPFALVGHRPDDEEFSPRFGFTFKFGFGLPETMQLVGYGERDFSRGEIGLHTAAAPLRDQIWGLGFGTTVSLGIIDEDPPEVFIDSDDVEYRSPNLDGVQDDLDLPITITDRGLIAGYMLMIEDEAGNLVRTIHNKDAGAESGGVESAVDRLLATKEQIDIPEILLWDGRSSGGQVVDDGAYNYYLEAWDDSGNRARSALRTVVIDTEPPQASLRAVELTFSPNDDGNKDTLTIQQEFSPEDRWQAKLVDAAGITMMSFDWDVDPPATLVWDGRRDDGTLAADGVYSYQLSGTDRAGNSAEVRLPNIIINTQSTPIAVRTTDSDISPNDDGQDDTADYLLEVPVATGVERWELTVRDPSGRVVRLYSGAGPVPAEVTFDGRDDAGRTLPEGIYQAQFDLTYENGNQPSAAAPELLIDLTAPAATVKASLAVFSPDGDGNKDTVTIFQETFDEAQWTGVVTASDGAAVRTLTWRGTPEGTFTWDGRSTDGLPAPDGVYYYMLEARDSAGNMGRSNSVELIIDTADTPVFLTTNTTHFSPNADGVADHIKLLPRLIDTEGVDRWTLLVEAGRGAGDSAGPVRSLSDRGSVPEQIIWDGLDDAGDRSPDGNYFATLQVFYVKGNNPDASSPTFAIDTTYPEAELTAESLLLSPDGDGERDEIFVDQSSTPEDTWEGEIAAESGQVVRTFFWKGELDGFSWDGTDENGNRVADGFYVYRVTGRDFAGNAATAVLEGIEVDSRPTTLFATIDTEGFSPNGDNVRDTQAVGIELSLAEGVQSWEIKFRHAERGVQRAMGGTGAVPERVVWDGMTDSGAGAPEGAYIAEVAVSYTKGNRPTAETPTFQLDRTPPRITLELSPQPFSPDDDGVDDELAMIIEVEDISPLSGWSMTITDPQGALFATFSGRGAPDSPITWGGRSDSGELVQSALDYPVALAVSDALGNTAIVNDAIPVDVLVIRDGDKLKIRVASITFPPNSADLSLVSGSAAELNARTIVRLGEIFTKNRSYTILIEGHANSVLYANPEAAAREQRDTLLPLSAARAEAVRRELVALGVSVGRMNTVGVGGANPVVPFSDEQNRWKNRRVEFILTGRGS
jgi:outer membrane protein OmpA-like peptidoglycan-associated protein/flagellar hook assembly protein FlgD